MLNVHIKSYLFLNWEVEIKIPIYTKILFLNNWTLNLAQILINKKFSSKLLKFLYNYTHFKADWDSKLDLLKDTIPKQLNFEVDPNLDTTRNLDHKS